MAFADISSEEALVLEAYEKDILDEEETLLAFELLDKSKDPILHRNYARFQFWQARLLAYHTYNAYLFKSNLIHDVIFIQLTVCCLSQNLFRLTFLKTKIKQNLEQHCRRSTLYEPTNLPQTSC